jgi:hypothetical protein
VFGALRLVFGPFGRAHFGAAACLTGGRDGGEGQQRQDRQHE